MKWNEQIKAARLFANLTQQKAALAIGLSLRNYQHIEAGTHFPSEATLFALCRELKMKVTYPEL